MRSVVAVGVGVTSGSAVKFNFWVTPFRTSTISGVYVDVARSLIATAEVGTEELNK
jgi:hypothetical protein